MILVTGSTGFVGGALVRRLAADPACTGVVVAVRRKSESRLEGVRQVLPKFRIMRVDTPSVATPLLDNPTQWLTPMSSFLRKASLDELPQLCSIFKGDMSFVGPRPALFNQDNLITLRTEKVIDALVPGLKGWSQVNGRDELLIPQKVAFEKEYLYKKSFLFDIKILWLTAMKVLAKKGVSY